MATTTDISICSAALTLLGADEISSFDDESRESKLCNQIYELVVQSCLSERNWHFSDNQVRLNKLTQVPRFGYTSAFQLPTDFIRFTGKDNPHLPHRQYEKYLYCNAEEIQISYIFRLSEQNFPPYFTKYVVYTMCKELAIALLEDENKAAYYDNEALKQRKKAGLIDSQNSGNKQMPLHNFSIIAVRM